MLLLRTIQGMFFCWCSFWHEKKKLLMHFLQNDSRRIWFPLILWHQLLLQSFLLVGKLPMHTLSIPSTFLHLFIKCYKWVINWENAFGSYCHYLGWGNNGQQWCRRIGGSPCEKFDWKHDLPLVGNWLFSWEISSKHCHWCHTIPQQLMEALRAELTNQVTKAHSSNY